MRATMFQHSMSTGDDLSSFLAERPPGILTTKPSVRPSRESTPSGPTLQMEGFPHVSHFGPALLRQGCDLRILTERLLSECLSSSSGLCVTLSASASEGVGP